MKLKPKQELGQFIRTCRTTKGLSSTELAKKIGKTTAHISKIENKPSESNLGYDTAEKIAEVLGQDKDYLLHLAGHTPLDVQEKLHENPKVNFEKARSF